MVRGMKSGVTAAIIGAVAIAAAVASGDQTFGAGVKLKDATPIAALYSTPEKFLGKTVRLDGVITSVCEEMGCWMALAAKDKPEQIILAKVHDGVIVFPVSARGHDASVQGVFEKIGAADSETKEAAQKQNLKDPKAAAFSQTYQVKATGAVVR